MSDHPFDPGKYAKFDAPGKAAVAAHLLAEGRWVIVNGENYNYDILEVNGEEGIPTMYHEVEVRSTWYGHPWRFPDISIVARKARQLNGKYHPLRFWCVSPNLKTAYFVDEHLVVGCTFTERWAEGQTHKFIAVPTGYWNYVNLKGGTPQ